MTRKLATGAGLLTVLVGVLSLPAIANDVDASFGGRPIYIEADEFDDERKADSWAGQIGFGLSMAPRFVGADEHVASLGFDLKVSYKDTIFLENNRIGAVLYRNRFVRAGAIARWNLGRIDTGSLSLLETIPEVDDAFELGGFAAASFYKLFLTTEVYFGVGDELKGTSVEVEAGYTFEPNSQWRITPILGAIWSSGRYLDTFYGVQEGNPDFAAYRPSGGLAETYVEIATERRLGKNWLFKGSFRFSELLNGAADSPIVQSDAGSRDQLQAFVGIVWLF